MFALPEAYTRHLNLDSCYYDEDEGSLVVGLELRVPAPIVVGRPAAELIDALAAADDDGQIDRAEALDAIMKMVGVGAGFLKKKT